jgi:hypothetical protein
MAIWPAPAGPIPNVSTAALAAFPTNTTINNVNDYIVNVRERVDDPAAPRGLSRR